MTEPLLKQVENEKTVKRNNYPYYVENPGIEKRVDKFLEAFAAVLNFTDYKSLLDSYCMTNTKCNRCAVACPVYAVTQDYRDIPCYKSNLLLNIYRRYFTFNGWLKSRLSLKSFELTDEIIDEMSDLFYRCTACKRCTWGVVGLMYRMLQHPGEVKNL